MRNLSFVVVLSLLAATATAAEEGGAAKPAAPTDAKAVNTVDPVSGEKVDATIAPISGKTKDGKAILIGVSSKEDAEKVRARPETYVEAAVANKKLDATATPKETPASK